MKLWQIVLMTLFFLLLTMFAAHIAAASFGLGTVAIAHSLTALMQAAHSALEAIA